MPIPLTIKHEDSGLQGPTSIIKRRWAMLLAALSTVLLIALPTSATAGGSVHVDIPGLSIGIHDDHYKKKRHRRVYKNKRHYNSHRRGYYNDYYGDSYDRRYSKKRHYEKRKYKQRRYNDSYYNKKRYYNNDYYYGGRSNRYNRRAEICPVAGYSPYYNDNLNCYRHEDHFHCS